MKREKVSFVSKEGYKVSVYFPSHWKKPIEENAEAVDRSVAGMIRNIVKDKLGL